MRRKIIAGVALLAVGAIADVIWVKTRHRSERVEITLILHGAGADCTIALEPDNGDDDRTTPCTGGDVMVKGVAPGDYQICVDKTCSHAIIREAPAVQTLSVTP